MKKILGIDTGTNSLGWAIVEQNEEEGNHDYRLVDYGVNIFQEGVKIEKGIESSKAAERTAYRSLRKHYWRRKVRKIRLLTILSEAGLCPALSKDQLRMWRTSGIYPQSEALKAWERTDDSDGINPYAYRHRCLHEELDMQNTADRYVLGRALYHINQRRGFLSNRKDADNDDETGKVKGSISELSADMKNAGCDFLGDYFYMLYNKGERIRSHYTARNDHYLTEFRAICSMQHLDVKLTARLEKAIFSQRPLKSQKGLVANCPFEPKKKCCAISHPLFEEFRMWSFVNNIKIKTPQDNSLRPLTSAECETILPLFFRMKKDQPVKKFDFEDIAKALAGKSKKNYGFVKTEPEKPYTFNYHMDTSVSACPVTAALRSIFGDKWASAISEVYTLSEGKSLPQIIDDIWHALFSFDDEEHLKKFASTRLQLDEEQAAKFATIRAPQGYSSISLKAIRNILPYMKHYGLRYSEAVFLGKLSEIVPYWEWEIEDRRELIIEKAINAMRSDTEEDNGRNTEQRLKDFLRQELHATDSQLSRLYHPSMIEIYPKQRPSADGIYKLGSPRISSMRNPVAMRSLFRLRHLVNTLLREKKIDEGTTIRIEFARELNDANRRSAISMYQRENEKRNENYKEELRKLFKDYGIEGEPSASDVRKYQLWEEQDHICVYTGKEIGVADFIGDNPRFDIEHTIPRSAGGDSTMENLTLCDSKFNRETKRTFLPTQLENHEEILARIAHWKEEAEKQDYFVRKEKSLSKAATDKKTKDSHICKRHLATLRRNYWRGKYERFTMTNVPEGFSRRQGVDISVISRYARLYLKSVFPNVYTVRGIATSDFRQAWGLQEEFSKKERVNHAHHCIDAITIACIGPTEYANLAKFYHEDDNRHYFGGKKTSLPKPWPTFVEDVKSISDSLIVVHNTPRLLGKHTRKKDSKGNIMQGDTARGPLHKETYYGAIKREGEEKLVIRKAVDALSSSDISKIVDPVVRAKVESAIYRHGSLKNALAKNDLWMNREKGIKIRKVRIFAYVTEPLDIRRQRDISRLEYKRAYHVANDTNYEVAVYEGENKKGKIERKFEIVTNLSASAWFKRSSSARQAGDTLVSPQKEGYPLICHMYVGTLVILYEKSVDEIYGASKESLQRRLYKVTGLEKDGRVTLIHHQEARPSKDLGRGDSTFNPGGIVAQSRLRLKISKLRGLIEHHDFTMNDIGEIKFIRK